MARAYDMAPETEGPTKDTRSYSLRSSAYLGKGNATAKATYSAVLAVANSRSLGRLKLCKDPGSTPFAPPCGSLCCDRRGLLDFGFARLRDSGILAFRPWFCLIPILYKTIWGGNSRWQMKQIW